MATRPAPRAEPPPGPHFVFLLTLAYRRLQRWSDGDRDGATAAQAGVLFSIDPARGALIGDVAKAIGVGPSGISGLIDRMETGALVRRAPDPDDGRAVRLFLTMAGRTARAAAKRNAAAKTARLVEGFSPAELDVVARWLRHVDQRFKKDDDR